MDLQLTGKRALVSGGSKGIGLAIARALLAEGAVVAISARGEEVAEVAARLSAEAASTGSTTGRAIGVRADTRDDASVRAAVAEVVSQLGGLDILVNTAAQPWNRGPLPATQTTDDMMREHFETKSLGYLRMARAAAPHMVANGWGRIVNVSGLGARQAGSVAQTVRNVAVSAITKNLADELGPQGVNVTVVHPGVTRTESGPAADVRPVNTIQRIVDASEVADVVAFLASPRSAAITGDAIAVGGGVPGPVYY
jgi:NAD(P)-dependent dehydrogenase (short-subunit alcohol dehydrogenase family)